MTSWNKNFQESRSKKQKKEKKKISIFEKMCAHANSAEYIEINGWRKGIQKTH